ncbi:MAG: N-acetylmuramoyl-L-alanine amidase [Gemmatimonadales bacterium]|nr:N-acetylmuramoyl-L-alanine amidase [Gemmatimonadales bacterium]
MLIGPSFAPIIANKLPRFLLFPVLAIIPGLILGLFTGCATIPTPPPPQEIPGYQQLCEEFGPRDFGPLVGRRLVLDPGHGGFFRGALGPRGLSEAEVNLGVALYLRGLLEWAGAEVYLTRTADYDFLAGTDSTLVADLAFRVSMSDSLQPDVFLSIHHNSTASRDKTINETQTYYPLNDTGASLDLARAVHRHLVRNLEIYPAKILPGNFHVLRNATVPAILGEPAMISHPVMEDRLSLAASQELEAQAYFLGLLDYFAGGTPIWSGASIDTFWVKDTDLPPLVQWTFLPSGRISTPDSKTKPGPGPDPGSFRLTSDGAETGFHLSADGHTVTWQPQGPAPSQPVELILEGQNLAGRSAPLRRTLLMPSVGNQIRLRILVSEHEIDSGPFLVHWQSTTGFPVPPGYLTLSPGGPVRLGGGVEEWLTIDDSPEPNSLTEARFLPDGAFAALAAPCKADTLPPLHEWRLMEGGSDGPDLGIWFRKHPWVARVLPGSLPPLSCLVNPTNPVVPIHVEEPVWITARGLLPFVTAAPHLAEDLGTVLRHSRVWQAVPLLPEVMGKVVILDPAINEPLGHRADFGTGRDIGPLGLRGTDVNLAVARYAARLLAGAGAEVHLTHRDGARIPNPDKIRLAEREKADLFLTIGRASTPRQVTAAHHPGSTAGEAWANYFLQAWGPLSTEGDSLLAHPSWAYLLRHTACPALELELPGPNNSDDEERLGKSGWQRAEARAVFLSVVAALGETRALDLTIQPLDIASRLNTGFPPEAIDWMELDGNFIWAGHEEDIYGRDRKQSSSPDPGIPISSNMGPGLPAVTSRHTLEIHAGSSWQLWLLDRSKTGWNSRLLLQGP